MITPATRSELAPFDRVFTNRSYTFLAAMTDGNIFGRVLRRCRTASGLSQDALAANAQLSESMVHLLEIGKRKPTLETMLKLCKGLDISFSKMAIAIEDEISNSDQLAGEQIAPPWTRKK